MKPLNSKYTIEVDKKDKITWDNIIKYFSDANIYQTWDYNEIRWENNITSQFILKKDGNIVAASQVGIKMMPKTNFGIAYIRWGPLWRVNEGNHDIDILVNCLRGLYNEYVYRRRLVLRIYPYLYENNDEGYYNIFKDEGYNIARYAGTQRTIFIYLRSNIDDIRKGLAQKWRNQLNSAEKKKMEIQIGTGNDLFDIFLTTYENMIQRKRFIETVDINMFKNIQKKLPDELKMKIVICKKNDIVYSGAIISFINENAVYLFGATSNEGLKSNGSYLIQWRIIESLKKYGCSVYDLNGINKTKNPGPYHFKAGLCGRNGNEVQFLGQFDAYRNRYLHFLLVGYDIVKYHYYDMVYYIKSLIKSDRLHH